MSKQNTGLVPVHSGAFSLRLDPSLQRNELDPVQHLSRLYRLAQELEIADAVTHVGAELPGEHDARKCLAEALPALGLTEQVRVHRKEDSAERACTGQEVAVRHLALSLWTIGDPSMARLSVSISCSSAAICSSSLAWLS